MTALTYAWACYVCAKEAEARGETSWPSIIAAEVSHRKYVPLDIVSVLSSPAPPTEARP